MRGGLIFFFFSHSYFPLKSVINNSHIGWTCAHKNVHTQISKSQLPLPNRPNVCLPAQEHNTRVGIDEGEGVGDTKCATYTEVFSFFVLA